MKLEHAINWSIYNYPTLYRSKTHSESRLKVLDQFFFTIGNGLEWHKDGFLFEGNQRNFRKTLPKDFFEKNLYTLTIIPKSIPLIKKRMDDRFYYMTKKSRFQEVDVIFEAENDEEALPFYKDLEKKQRKDLPSYVYEARSAYPNEPYQLCEYSALVEILNGKVNSPRQESFDLVPQSDWLQGCIEAAVDALDYYNDTDRNCNNFNHAHKLIAEMNRDVQRGVILPEKWLKNMKTSETIEQYAWRIWDDIRKEQINILSAFLAKFKGVEHETIRNTNVKAFSSRA